VPKFWIGVLRGTITGQGSTYP